MVGAVQTFGDLIHWQSHIHAIVPEGVFTESGLFVHIPDIWRHRAAEFRQERVFSLQLDEHKITAELAGKEIAETILTCFVNNASLGIW
jgi:hypothetical protein